MSEDNLPAILVLIGAPGAGKSRIGKRVARLLDVDFIDTDKRIVAGHGPIAEIFESHGEPHFRALERAAVADALGSEAVVALGGGAVLDPDTQAQLRTLPVVQLTVTAEAVAARIVGDKRPLLAAGIESWQQLVDSRRALYDRLSKRDFDTSHLPAEKIAADIADWIQEQRS